MSEYTPADKLRRMRFLMNRRPMALFRVEQAWSRATRITPVLSDMPKGGRQDGDTVGRSVADMDAARDALDRIDTELGELRAWLAPQISSIQKPLTRTCMIMRYMEGRTARQIAIDLCYAERHIHREIAIGEKNVIDVIRKDEI